MAISIPTVHMNGTGKDELLEQHIAVLEACRALTRALNAANPNGRDYYPQGAGALSAALAQHAARLLQVQTIAREINEISEGIAL